MSKKIRCEGSLEEFTSGGEEPYTEMYLHKDDRGFGGELSYPISRLPTAGRFFTQFDITITVSEDQLETAQTVGKNIAEHLYRGELAGGTSKAIRLYDIAEEQTNSVAGIRLPNEVFEKYFSQEGDECFVLIKLEYDHEAQLEYYSESEIQEQREAFEEYVEEFTEKYI